MIDSYDVGAHKDELLEGLARNIAGEFGMPFDDDFKRAIFRAAKQPADTQGLTFEQRLLEGLNWKAASLAQIVYGIDADTGSEIAPSEP